MSDQLLEEILAQSVSPKKEEPKLMVIQDDPYLAEFEADLELRQSEFKRWLKIFKEAEGGITNIGKSYQKCGLHVNKDNEIVFREWAPAAKSMSLFGDFNDWNRSQFWCKKDQFGWFSVTIPPNADGSPRI